LAQLSLSTATPLDPKERWQGAMLIRPEKARMTRQLLIVSRSQQERYAYLRYVFDSETGDVILDRRVRDRRGRQEPAPAERRRAERRQRDVTSDLQAFGWALVRYEAK
jgi:hypothetical protein